MNYYTNRGQGIVLVLYALKMLGGSNTKQEVLECIAEHGWYDVKRCDLKPYPGQNEARYHTLLAWARKDCYEFELLIPTDERNDWSLSRLGHAFLEDKMQKYRTKIWDVRLCYLWKPTFQRLMDPTYIPSSMDAVRPPEKPDKYPELTRIAIETLNAMEQTQEQDAGH